MKQTYRHAGTVLGIGLAALIAGSLAAYAAGQAAFTSPRKGSIIENRQDFSVSIDIRDLDPDASYWVAIASVRGHDDTWDRVRELFDQGEQRSAEMADLVSAWDIDLLWPKYYVPKSKLPYHGQVFDGGSNPLHGLEPQPMVLVLLEVDDALEDRFRAWFQRGSQGAGYPGIPFSVLRQEMVIARCEIFFP